jgi:hypothetical protein
MIIPSKALGAPPTRMKCRMEREDPIISAFKTDELEPNATLPKTEKKEFTRE